jgi:hypothetical protein
MTDRDEIASRALAGILAGSFKDSNGLGGIISAHDAAIHAVRAADALIKELQETRRTRI